MNDYEQTQVVKHIIKKTYLNFTQAKTYLWGQLWENTKQLRAVFDDILAKL